MRYYFAPMEGITDSIYRRLHHKHFGGVDRYYMPFLSPTIHRTLTNREDRELPYADSVDFIAIPQLLTKVPEDFLWAAQVCLDRGYDHPIYQVILYMNDQERTALPPMPGIKFTSWNMGGADGIPVSGGKATGIAKVLEHYGIDKSETMAFGDGQNDVDMFSAVGTAVAMGNACRAAKEAADYITDPVDGDGIWNALKHFGVL